MGAAHLNRSLVASLLAFAALGSPIGARSALFAQPPASNNTADIARTPLFRSSDALLGAVVIGSFLSIDPLRAGRSFVTNGPLLDFRLDGARPGDAVDRSAARADWTLDLCSAVPVERVEILVNGEPVWSGAGTTDPGRRRSTAGSGLHRCATTAGALPAGAPGAGEADR